MVLTWSGYSKLGTAKIMAPLYALAEGLALGAITAAYASGSNGIAPLAIIFTAGIFIGALIVFRSGLVKVTQKFISMVLMASIGSTSSCCLAASLGLFPGLSGPDRAAGSGSSGS